MRSIWRGAISFGLVTIPIRLFTATESPGISFNQLHAPCGARIRYVKKCSACGQEVPPEEIVRGYEYAQDRYVVVTDEDLKELPLPTAREISILDFVPTQEVDPAYFKTPYYIAPDDIGARAYRLLAQTLGETGRGGVCQVALRQKEHLGLIRAQGDLLWLHLLHYAREIRSPPPLPQPGEEPPAREKELARALVGALESSFSPEKYRDGYQEALTQLIQAKIEGREVLKAPGPRPEPVMDLARALEESLQTLGR